MQLYFFVYFLAVSLITFAVYGVDKHRAVRHRWRISERTLLLFAAAGGSIGALCGMFFFHHKTRHPKFYLGIPAIMALQLLILWALLRFVL